MNLQRIEVGRPYHPDRRSWPQGVHFRLDGSGGELLLLMDRPTDSEVAAVRAGDADFALSTREGAILFLYRFGPAPKRKGGIPWGDGPFDPHRQRAGVEAAEPAATTAETRLLLTVVLIDARDGIVKAIRAVSLTPEFSRILFAEVREALGRPPVPDAAFARIQRLYTSEQLAKLALVRCRGGR